MEIIRDQYKQLLEDLLTEHNVRVTLRGMSMFPMLVKGDIVVVAPVAFDKLRKGDIIVFEYDSLLIAHRLISKRNGHVLTRGDGNSRPDIPIPFDKIKGKVIKIENSRWKIAKLAIKLPGTMLAFTGPVTGPAFKLTGIAAYRLLSLFRRLSGKEK